MADEVVKDFYLVVAVDVNYNEESNPFPVIDEKHIDKIRVADNYPDALQFSDELFEKHFAAHTLVIPFNLNQVQFLNNDLVRAWDEINEVETDLEQMTTGEIVDNLPTIKKRVQSAMETIGRYVTNEEVLELNGQNMKVSLKER